MRRRSMLVGLLSVACAPHREIEPSPEQSALPDGWPAPGPPEGPQPNALLVLGSWSAPVSGWMQDIAVYEDGLVELMWFEHVERPNNPFAMELHLESMRAAPERLAPLRKALASSGFADAEPSYHQEGVLDGGSLVIADQASHHRRVIIVNNPSDAPGEVRHAEDLLAELAEDVRRRGHNAFAQGRDRVLVMWSFERGKTSKRLTVHENGLLELRMVHTLDTTAHEARDYPTPYSSTRSAPGGEVEALWAALAAAGDEEPPSGRSDEGTLWFAGTQWHIPPAPSPKLVKVISLLEAMELSLQPG